MKSLLKNIISSAGNLLFYFKKKKTDREKINKILIMSLYFRGDVLFNTVAIRMLRKIFPYSTINAMVKSRSEDVLEGNPDIDKLIVFDDIKTADYNDSSKLKPKKKLSLLKKLRKEKYDLCIDFTGKYSTALIILLGKFKYSFGLNYNGFGFCYSGFVNTDTQNTKGHLTEKYLMTLKEGLGISESEWTDLNEDFNKECEINISRKDTEQAESKLRSLNPDPDRPLICIQVTAGWEAKEWNENSYSTLIEKLLKADLPFLLIGSEEDRDINYRILDAISPELRKYYVSLPLKVNAAAVRFSDVFIGSDSIGLHLAGAVGTPSVGLFGPTNPEFSNPPGERHRIIYKKLHCSAADDVQYCTRNAGKTCPSVDCMKSITPDEVMENVEFLLDKHFHKKRITA